MPFEPAQIVLGGIIGFGSNGLIRWWQYNRDLWIGSVERLCKEVENLADLAVDYWLISAGETNDENKGIFSYSKTEIKILGSQTLINGMSVTFSESLPDQERNELDTLFNELFDAAAGGDFGSPARKANYDQARTVQDLASELLLRIRSSSAAALSFRGGLRGIRQRSINVQRRAGADF